MSFVVLTFFLLAVLLTWTTKLVRDSKRKTISLKKHGKENQKTESKTTQ